MVGKRILLLVAVLWFTSSLTAGGEEGSSLELPNLQWRTLGGTQFWSDERIEAGWRIQRNVVTGHFRLLDEDDVRQAWGTERHCESALEEHLAENTPVERKSEAVVLLHGLGRTRHSMKPLTDHLRDEGFDTFDFGYASTRDSVDGHARSLTKVVDHLQDYDRLHFVGHSLGNLVVRRYLALLDEESIVDQPQVGHIVMLAPPNRGSKLATIFGENELFEAIAGLAGRDIVSWEELEQKLATPQVPFGILAGDGGGLENPLLEDGDLVVTIDETKLPGASDFQVVPAGHTFLMKHEDVLQYTARFLQHGYFVSPGQRSPLPAQPAETP